MASPTTGTVVVPVLPFARAGNILPPIREHVMPATTIFTDEANFYDALVRSAMSMGASITRPRSR